MHYCNYEQTKYDNGVTEYYCKGCEKGFFLKQ